MVELLADRLKRRLDIGKVDQPPRPGIHLALAGQLHLETVTVQAAALVPLGGLRQPMGRLEAEPTNEPYAVLISDLALQRSLPSYPIQRTKRSAKV